MKIKQRVAATAAVAVIAAMTLAACTSGGSSGSGDGKVSGTLTGIFASAFKSTYVKLAQGFEKKYPGVKVNFSYTGGDIGSIVLTQLQGGTAPDILTSFPGGTATDNADSMTPLAAQKRIKPLDVTWSSGIPKAWDTSFNYKGKTYAYPGAFQPLTAVYNQTELDKVGLKVPTTLDEVYKLCADAKAKGVYAYAQGLGEAAAGPQMLTFAQNATLVDAPHPTLDTDIANGKGSYVDSPWVDQFKIYKKMFDLGCFGEGALGRTRVQGGDAVAAGQALGIVDVGAVLATLKTAAPNAKFVVAPMPANNSKKTAIAALPGFVTTINAKAKNPAAAMAFLEYLGTPEASATYANGFASVPVIPVKGYKAPAELAQFAAAVDNGQAPPLGGIPAEVQSTLNQGLQSMFLGNDTPQSLAAKMQAALKK